MKKMLSNLLIIVICISTLGLNCIQVNAGYKAEKKYTFSQCISWAKEAPMLNTLRRFSDNHGYYAVYDYFGRVEKYLGKSNEKITFSDFSKKMGGKSYRTVTTCTITKTEYELKKLATAALVLYVCAQLGAPWYASCLIGYASDKGVSAALREPGKYKQVIITTEIPIYNPMLRENDGSYWFISVSRLKKYNEKTKKYEDIYCDKTPRFLW